MNKQNEKFDRAIESLRGLSVPPGPSNELIRQTLDRIEQTKEQPLPHAVGKRSMIMKSLRKLSIAAVLVIGVSAFLLFNRTTGSIALADVYTKVQQARTFMYTMSMTMSGMGELTGGLPDSGAMTANGTVIISTDYGMKMENHMQINTPYGSPQNITQLAYMLPNDKIIVSIMPEQKTYQKIELTGQLLEETKKQNNDPREMIRQMMNCKYVSLGQSEINGVKVQGFETTDPAYSSGLGDVRAVLWVDAKTWLPVQSEASMTMGEKMRIEVVISDFQWDVPVDAAEFVYVIPDDYKEFGSMKMPEMTEEAAVKGLEAYQQIFGKYPKKLDIVDLTSSLSKSIATMEVSDAFKEKMEAAKAAGGDGMEVFSQEIVAPITSLALFHMKLVQDKRDPIYYGRTVTPGDGSAVLLRWKAESGKYKVIFGDLSTTEMDFEELVKIEPEIIPEDEPESESSAIGIDDPAAQAAQAGAQLSSPGQSMMNIKRMLLACYMHGDKNGEWPDTLESLLGKGIEPELLVNPAQPQLANGYIYVKPALPDDLQRDPDKKIVIYEAYETWGKGICAGFADGHVEFIKDEADFLKRLSQ